MNVVKEDVKVVGVRGEGCGRSEGWMKALESTFSTQPSSYGAAGSVDGAVVWYSSSILGS